MGPEEKPFTNPFGPHMEMLDGTIYDKNKIKSDFTENLAQRGSRYGPVHDLLFQNNIDY